MTSSPILPEPLPVAAISENQYVQGVIDFLDLQRHTVGGYLVETDRDPKFPKSFQNQKLASNINNTVNTLSGSETRDVSTKIFCYLTSGSPFGAFHRNKSRTIHTLHWGRGRYVTIHADEVAGTGQKARVETFVVGKNLLAGEKTQWIVEEGIYKSSFLLPDEATGLDGENNGLLISEVKPPIFLPILSSPLRLQTNPS